ncbi:unnamed protein product [Eretmochelys imbricata]
MEQPPCLLEMTQAQRFKQPHSPASYSPATRQLLPSARVRLLVQDILGPRLGGSAAYSIALAPEAFVSHSCSAPGSPSPGRALLTGHLRDWLDWISHNAPQTWDFKGALCWFNQMGDWTTAPMKHCARTDRD